MSKILLFGDICPTKDYRHLFDSHKIFSEDILSEIKAADYVLGNLECPATESDSAISKTGPNLRAKPADVNMLASIGFDAMSLANNHILDYGVQGINDTFSTLKLNGVKYFGAGNDDQEASKALIVNINDKSIGFLSFAEAEFNLALSCRPGANHFDPFESLDAIRSLKSKVDYLIVLYHGGIEYYQYPSPLVQKKCRKMIDCGADLVSIQHSHCIGSIENYKDGHIIYGQGNSVFGVRPDSSTWNQGLLVSIDPDTALVEYRLMSAEESGVRFADELSNNKVLDEVLKRSKNLTNPEWLKKSWLGFCLAGKSMTLPQLYGRGKWFNRLNRLTNNKLIDFLYSKFSKMVTLNLIRCEAHREVISTILEHETSK